MKVSVDKVYIFVGWPESQNYVDDNGVKIDVDIEDGPDGSLFVPLKVYNKINHTRITIKDKTFE